MLNKKYPPGWQILPLYEITDTFLNGGTPSTSVPYYWDGTIPWITGADTEQRVTTKARNCITERGVRESATNIVPKGNILLVTRTGVGKVSISGVDIAISQDLTGVILKQDIVDVSYLYWQLSHLGPELQRLAQGTIIQGIQREEVEALHMPLPSLPEQRRIAETLDTADEAIRQTERLIAKLKAVKAGLLHDLLTRGLDEHGRLRDPQAHPEQFKDSPLGRIPEEWEIRRLGDLARNSGEYGSGAAALEYNPNLPRYVRITDITDDGRLDPNSRASIHGSDAEGYYLRYGDLVFARSGATVGKTYLYDETDGECAHAGYVIKFSLDLDLCKPRFVFYWTQSGVYWSWVKRTLRQGAQPNINAQEYKQLELVYPPPKEQRRIAAILNVHDARIRAEEAILEKLRQVKRGLMDDLLTGKLRVSV